MRRVLFAALLTGAAATTVAAITIRPSAHDYGKVAVSGSVLKTFQVSAPTGAGPNDTITAVIAGADASDFLVMDMTGVPPAGTDCWSHWRGGLCDYQAVFMPKSRGVKHATLVVTDTRGNRGTAQLTGEGVDAVCEMKVVSCNYAHLYSGVFSWTSGLKAPSSTYSEFAQVNVVNGVATCNGGATQSANGRTNTAPIRGSGLIAVEFDRDDTYRLVYKITVACPTPAWPPEEPGEPGTPSQPAELGQNEQTTYNQNATAVGMPLLNGSHSYPSPDTDPVNGVTGIVTVNWNLIHK